MSASKLDVSLNPFDAAVRAASEETRAYIHRKLPAPDRLKIDRIFAPAENVNNLLNVVAAKLGAKNDRALAAALGVPPPTISKLRHYRMSVTPAMLMRLHESTDMPINELKSLLATPMQ